MSTYDFDVAIVGAGPTGLTVANLLGQAGVNTILIERNESTVQAPRAVSIDDESLRTMQAAGLIQEVLADIALDYGSHYIAENGTCFATIEPKTREFGYPRRSAFLQPLFEATLRKGLERWPSLTPSFGTECLGIKEDDGGVDVETRKGAQAPRTIRARYVVGTDGGRSPLRKAIGATLTGSSYEQPWLIVDLGSTKETFRQTRVLCNTSRPAICLPGPRGTRRYEFMVNPGEDDETVSSEAFVRKLLAENGPDRDAPIVRRQVYTFHARIVDKWNSERVYLAGDAAHLTPPFAGQGMNSGQRDAHNLAWKLAAVCQGQLGHGLLASYAEERSKHAWALIELAIKLGRVMMPKSPRQAKAIQGFFKAARLVPAVQSYFAEMKYKPKPFLEQGFLTAGDGPAKAIVGRMLQQPVLSMTDGTTRLMDDVIGPGFGVVAYGRNAVSLTRKLAGIDMGIAGMTTVTITPKRWNPEAGPYPVATGRDVEGRLAHLPEERGMLILVRPDRYAAAAVAASEIDAATRFAGLVRDLAARTRTNSARPASVFVPA